ncbi:hypothetical protein J6590_054519 [Homalodisca vitripennis]|nr:hypothetical protein J6590_054519 [Homalodisca vitripennis]
MESWKLEGTSRRKKLTDTWLRSFPFDEKGTGYEPCTKSFVLPLLHVNRPLLHQDLCRVYVSNQKRTRPGALAKHKQSQDLTTGPQDNRAGCNGPVITLPVFDSDLGVFTAGLHTVDTTDIPIRHCTDTTQRRLQRISKNLSPPLE